MTFAEDEGVTMALLTVLEWPKVPRRIVDTTSFSMSVAASQDTRARYPKAWADTWRVYLGTTFDRHHDQAYLP